MVPGNKDADSCREDIGKITATNSSEKIIGKLKNKVIGHNASLAKQLFAAMFQHWK